VNLRKYFYYLLGATVSVLPCYISYAAELKWGENKLYKSDHSSTIGYPFSVSSVSATILDLDPSVHDNPDHAGMLFSLHRGYNHNKNLYLRNGTWNSSTEVAGILEWNKKSVEKKEAGGESRHLTSM